MIRRLKIRLGAYNHKLWVNIVLSKISYIKKQPEYEAVPKN